MKKKNLQNTLNIKLRDVHIILGCQSDFRMTSKNGFG